MHSREWVRKHTTTWQQQVDTQSSNCYIPHLYILYMYYTYRLLCTDMNVNAKWERKREREREKQRERERMKKESVCLGRQRDDGTVFIDYFDGYTNIHTHTHLQSFGSD